MDIHFDADVSDWLTAFSGFDERVKDATPVHETIGDFLIAEARGNIDTDGGATHWPPLSPATLKKTPRPGDKMLVVSGDLRDSVTKDPQPDHVDVGSSLVYARTQFYGRGNIPKRTPFAWLSGVMTRIGEMYIRWLVSGVA